MSEKTPLVVADDLASPVAVEYLRQALDFESPRVGWFNLTGLYDAAPDCAMAPPLIWKFFSKALRGTDPLEGAEIIDEKVYADPIMATNYAIHIGGLGDAFYAFVEEAKEREGVFEPLVKKMTTDRAFFAIALTLSAHAEEGRFLAPIEAINHLRSCLGQWAVDDQRASVKDVDDRFLAALFGNRIPPALALVGA